MFNHKSFIVKVRHNGSSYILRNTGSLVKECEDENCYFSYPAAQKAKYNYLTNNPYDVVYIYKLIRRMVGWPIQIIDETLRKVKILKG